MNRRHQQPYKREFQESFDMLDRMSQDEHDALLREAGILDDNGKLAARYSAPTDVPAESTAATS